MLPRRRLDLGRGRRLADWLFDDSAGLLVSGDSGSGKSTFLCALIVLLAKLGHGCTLFDPHGDLAQKVKRLCLALGPSVARRLVEVVPGDTSVVTLFNPLSVEEAGLDPYTRGARITAKCGHAARILLHAWGETDFNGKPLLYKWTNRLLVTAAELGLPLAALRHVLAVGSPLYDALTRVAPDLLARLEFAELKQMRPRDREELIASTKNRVLGFLSNPAVEATLSRTDGTLCPRQLLRERAILLFDLSKRSALRDEDQEILSNLWLSELLHAIFATPEAERVPHWIVLDELPVFTSCAPLITAASRQVRKFLTRFVCAFQGTTFFERRTEDRLLHALVGQCSTHVLFRHIDPADATFFGEIVALPQFSPTRVKHVLTQPQQYQAGHAVAVLTDTGETWGDADQQGGSDAQGTSDTTTDTATTQETHSTGQTVSTAEETLRKTVSDARATVTGRSTSTAQARGQTRTETATWSRTASRGGSTTRKQTLVPILRWRDVVTAVQFLTPEEQTRSVARILASLRRGHALLYRAGSSTVEVTIPWLADPAGRTPTYTARKEAELRRQLLERAAYALPAEVSSGTQAFLAAWLERLQALPTPSEDLPEARPAGGSACAGDRLPHAAEEGPPASPLAI
jgi:hypothetical protein